MALVRVVAKNAGFRAVANSPEMRRALAQVAEKGKAHAEEIAQDFRVSGEYAASFEVRATTAEFKGRFPGPRAAAELRNTSDHAAAVEYGYKGRSDAESSSAHRVIGRTAEWLEQQR